MNKTEVKSILYKRLDADLQELVRMAIILEGGDYLKCYLMAGIIQELREIHRTNGEIQPL